MTQPTLQPVWFADQLEDRGGGQFAIKQPNGAYTTFLGDGTLAEQPNGAFDQEVFRLAPVQPSTAYTTYIADRTDPKFGVGRSYLVLVFPR